MVNTSVLDEIEGETRCKAGTRDFEDCVLVLETERLARSPRAERSMLASTRKCPRKCMQKVGDRSKRRGIDGWKDPDPCDRLQPIQLPSQQTRPLHELLVLVLLHLKLPLPLDTDQEHAVPPPSNVLAEGLRATGVGSRAGDLVHLLGR